MVVLGWLLAYWGIWMVLGSFVLSVRFPGFWDGLGQLRELPLKYQLSALVEYILRLTMWPKVYNEGVKFEEGDDDEGDDSQAGAG